jgi:hypothetical protein
MRNLKTMQTQIKMNKWMNLCVGLIALPAISFAQHTQVNDTIPAVIEYKQNDKFYKTPPLRDIAVILDEQQYEPKEGNAWERRPRQAEVNPDALPHGMDPVAQTEMGTRANRVAEVNFNGMNGAFPPDPSGAAGHDYYVQAVNTSYRVYNKDGSPAYPQMGLSTLWPGSTNDGDPIVMYDRHADRWVITQFQQSGNKILFAVSETDDPLGSYFTYEYSFSQFPDYPKYSIWSDGYYMTANTWSQNVVVFDREKMLAGDPTAGRIALSFPSGVSYTFRSVLPADADGELPPYGTPNYMFHIQDDSWSGVTYDHIVVFKFQTDWSTPVNSSVTISQRIPTAPFNANFTSQWNDIPQPGTSQRLDAIAGIFNYRAQYMRWVNYNTMMLCHVVDVNNASSIANKRAGIRWYELRQYGNDAEWEIHQQGTFAPGTDHRWLGSIAMDAHGHIGMGYSIAGPDRFASLAYTGRFSWDPLGEMTLQELIAVDGQSAQTSGNRFGDYAQLSLDPADPTVMWYTGEYLGTSQGRRTRIFSFRVPSLMGEHENILDKLDWTLINQSGQLQVAVKGVPDNQDIHVDLFDLNGKELAGVVLRSESEQVATQFATSGLATGTYLVRIGNSSFQDVKKVVIH